VEEPEKKPDTSLVDALWEKVSARLGVSSETVQKIKFGRGAAGKIAIIAVTAFAAIAAMALRMGASAVYVGIGAVVIVALGSFGLIFYIVSKRPELAVMEGAELVMYQHVTLRAKGRPSYAPDASPVILPGTSTPQIAETPREVSDGD
jgi:hypothetical protein